MASSIVSSSTKRNRVATTAVRIGPVWIVLGLLFSALAQDDSSADWEVEESDTRSAISVLWNNVLDALRVSLQHELAVNPRDFSEVVNNRSSVRLEYSKFLIETVFLRFDAKLVTYWKQDHRSKRATLWANDEKYQPRFALGASSREAYFHFSFHKTSLKVGYQTIIWGESDAGAVTDEISPRNNSELFFVTLDESRISQPMVTLDQYSRAGRWSLVIVPAPRFNEGPAKGTAYYRSVNNLVSYHKDKDEEKSFREYVEHVEYALSWKKTLGPSDLSLMAASLIDNEYSVSFEPPDMLKLSKDRIAMGGLTANLITGSLLFKAEAAVKVRRKFLTTSLSSVEKNAVDVLFGFDYSPRSTFQVGLESMNGVILNWSEEILGIPEYTHTLTLLASKRFLNEQLTISGMCNYTEPHRAFLNVLNLAYRISDPLSLQFEAHMPIIEDRRNPLWTYRNEKRLVGKLQYQF